MYKYNLIIKRGDLDHPSAVAMVERELTNRFGSDVEYTTVSILDNEVVVIVSGVSKRNLQVVLGDWFAESPGAHGVPHSGTYPVGTLLHYRQITSDEPLYNRLGG